VPETAPPSLRVEIADAGGTLVGLPARIAEALRAQRIEARVVSLEAIVASTADAVVLRGDAPGALAVLRALRDDGVRPDTPVLLLGTPEGTGPFQEGPGFGAEHVLAKDASPETIAAVLRKITHRELPPEVSKERRVEHTMELAARGEAGDWRTHGGEPPRAPTPPASSDEPPAQVSEIVPSPELSVVLDSDSREANRRRGSGVGERGERHDSVVPSSSPGTGVSQSGLSSPGTGSVPSTSQLFVVASISDELRKILFDADRRVFPERPPIDVSLPRGDEAARELVPDEFVEAFSLALDEPERVDLELTFVGAGAVPRVEEIIRPAPRAEPADDQAPAEDRPRTHPGTPTSMSKRPPPEGETRSAADPQLVPPRPRLRDDVSSGRPSSPPPRVALAGSERGELAPLGALALIGQLAIGRLDVALALRVEDRPVVLSLARGELVSVSGEGWIELRRRALHRSLASTLGEGRATEASRGEPTFALERASRLAEEGALAEVIARASGSFTLEPRVAEPTPRITRRTLAATVFEVTRQGVSPDRVAAFYLTGPEDPSASRFERLSRLEIARLPALERVLDLVEAPREVVWLLRSQTATSPTTVGNLLAAAPDEPGLVGAVFAVVQLGGLSVEVLAAPASLAHTDLDARAEKAIGSLRERADRADYFEILGISRESDGVAVVDAHYRLRGELMAWPLADLGLARLEPDRMRILSVLDDAAEVLTDPRQRGRYRTGLERGLAAERPTP